MERQNKPLIDLGSIIEEQLLNTRICDLPITITGTWLEGCVQELYEELKAKGINYQPPCYLADEWMTPEHETCIGIPFYLAHLRLIQLERKFMIDAEGETKPWCMKLLRHEAGHALTFAFNFHKRRQWQRLFGPSTQEYADTYRYRPYSKNYVRHLDGYYAQYHPEEDFVETFSVWLTPDLDWRTGYAGWKALDKLNYVDELMREIRGVNPPHINNARTYRLSTLRMTLANYYKKKRHLLAEDYPDFHDPFLKKIFREKTEADKKGSEASIVIARFRRDIRRSVARLTGEKKYVIDDLLKVLLKRAQELKLVSTENESTVGIQIASYITSLIMNYLYTGHFRAEHPQRKK